MARKLTQQQEGFCLDVFQEIPAGKAYLTHYKCKPSAADSLASRLLRNAKIQSRLQELRKKAEDASVASVLERKQRLSEIARANVPDFIDDENISVDKDSPNVGAVSEITTRTQPWGRGREPVTITNLKLHNPIQAIDLLNKMDKIYTDSPTVNVDNRKIEIHVNSEKGKELTERLIDGERTQS